MLKVRLMGTKNDITWFKKIMQRHPKIEVLELSDLYPNKGTDKYYRVYAEVKKRNGFAKKKIKIAYILKYITYNNINIKNTQKTLAFY